MSKERFVNRQKHCASIMAVIFFLTLAVLFSGSSAAATTVGGTPKKSWDLTTATTHLKLGVDSSDNLVVYALENPARAWNWTATASVISLPTRVSLSGGASYDPVTWKFQSDSQDLSKGTTLTLTFACSQAPGLSLKSVVGGFRNRAGTDPACFHYCQRDKLCHIALSAIERT